jgi:hypothetical protein
MPGIATFRCLNRLWYPVHALLKLAPGVGIGPTTIRLTAERSTIELPRNILHSLVWSWCRLKRPWAAPSFKRDRQVTPGCPLPPAQAQRFADTTFLSFQRSHLAPERTNQKPLSGCSGARSKKLIQSLGSVTNPLHMRTITRLRLLCRGWGKSECEGQ